MKLIWLVLGIFAALSAIAVPLWFWAERVRLRREKRDECRRDIHDLRVNPDHARLCKMEEACARLGIPLTEIGTRSVELEDLKREALRRQAEDKLKALRKGWCLGREAVPAILDLLRQARRPRAWQAAGATWRELQHAYQSDLIIFAGQLYQNMRQTDDPVRMAEIMAELEELFILSGAGPTTLDENVTDADWEKLKKA